MGTWDPVIRQFSDPVVRALAQCGSLRSHARGSVLMREGEDGTALFVILAGRVRVYVADARGQEMVLAHYGAGELVGEMALDGEPRSATVRAVEAVHCAVVERAALLELFAAQPEVALRLFSIVAARARAATGSVRNLALMDVYGRVARLLLEQETVVEADGRRWTREALTQQEIASRVGASRDMISRILKDLRTGGYIAERARRFTILRRPPARW